MKILTKLPPTPKEYFDFYHQRAYTELVGAGDLKDILIELRLAYKAYPEYQTRIKAIAGTLKHGLNRKLPKRINKPKWTKLNTNLVADAKDALL